MPFQRATREQNRLRMTINGPAGSGKTYTGLSIASVISHSIAKPWAAICTERGSIRKYVGENPYGTGIPWEFDCEVLTPPYTPERYTALIKVAEASGYGLLMIDSLSHAWAGAGGSLEKKMQIGDAWRDWRFVTPAHQALFETILGCDMHIIATMRSKQEYVQEQNAAGKYEVRRVGMDPVQRPDSEYEFDIVMDMDMTHTGHISKSRCAIIDGITVARPGPDLAETILHWLLSGSAPAPREPMFLSLIDLVDIYGMDAVMDANGGALPLETDAAALTKILAAK